MWLLLYDLKFNNLVHKVRYRTYKNEYNNFEIIFTNVCPLTLFNSHLTKAKIYLLHLQELIRKITLFYLSCDLQ